MAVPVDLFGGEGEVEEGDGVAVFGEGAAGAGQEGLFEGGRSHPAAINRHLQPIGAATMAAIGQPQHHLNLSVGIVGNLVVGELGKIAGLRPLQELGQDILRTFTRKEFQPGAIAPGHLPVNAGMAEGEVMDQGLDFFELLVGMGQPLAAHGNPPKEIMNGDDCAGGDRVRFHFDHLSLLVVAHPPPRRRQTGPTANLQPRQLGNTVQRFPTKAQTGNLPQIRRGVDLARAVGLGAGSQVLPIHPLAIVGHLNPPLFEVEGDRDPSRPRIDRIFHQFPHHCRHRVDHLSGSNNINHISGQGLNRRHHEINSRGISTRSQRCPHPTLSRRRGLLAPCSCGRSDALSEAEGLP